MFVALVIQHAISMRRILLWSVTCLTAPYLFILSHKSQDFLKKNFLKMKCVFIYYLEDLAETFLIKKELSDELYIHRGPHVKYPLFSSDFNETCFSRHNFEKIFKYKRYSRQISMKRVFLDKISKKIFKYKISWKFRKIKYEISWKSFRRDPSCFMRKGRHKDKRTDRRRTEGRKGRQTEI